MFRGLKLKQITRDRMSDAIYAGSRVAISIAVISIVKLVKPRNKHVHRQGRSITINMIESSRFSSVEPKVRALRRVCQFFEAL